MTATDATRPKALRTRDLDLETVGGLVLVLVTTIALVLANSRWADDYARWLAWTPSLDVGGWSIAISVRTFVDEGLMTLFLFSVSLEIRRELHAGELAEPAHAALPATAALGGMLLPALLYVAINPAEPGRHGWGVAMTTDIVFAVVALVLLGRRAPPALRVLLLALALLDDIGGAIITAFFYSHHILPRGLIVCAIGTFLAMGMRDNGVRSPWPYVVPALVAWSGLRYAGIHPTMAGVIMGLVTPPRTELGTRPDEAGPDDRRSPSERLQAALHPWIVLLVMPCFAFANAGITLDVAEIDPRVTAGVVVGLVVGKPLGIVTTTWVAARLRLVRLPAGVEWPGVILVGLLAGVGFTAALGTAGLAFPDPSGLASAELGVLGGSSIAIALAATLGWTVVSSRPRTHAAEPPDEDRASGERPTEGPCLAP